MAKPSTRPALLRLVKQDGPQTAAQLAAALGVSAVAVRKPLREYHCPIRDVAERYRAACRCEQELFRDLLGAQVEYVASLLKGAPACTYRIPLTSSEKEPAQ